MGPRDNARDTLVLASIEVSHAVVENWPLVCIIVGLAAALVLSAR
jgi:hypothetical protein